MWCSVHIVCPSVLSCSNLKLRQTLEAKNIFRQENVMLQLTFNPGLTLTGFPTTQPRGTGRDSRGTPPHKGIPLTFASLPRGPSEVHNSFLTAYRISEDLRSRKLVPRSRIMKTSKEVDKQPSSPFTCKRQNVAVQSRAY